MSARGWGRHVIAAGLGAALLPAASALPPAPAPMQPGLPPQPFTQPPPLPSRAFSTPVARPQFSSVQQLDEALDALRQTSWQLHSMFGSLEDSRGRTAAQDVDRWLLTPAHEAQLKDLRAKAGALSAKGDRRDLIITLNVSTGLVGHEAYMAGMLTTYWSLWSLVAQHMANLQGIAARISPAVPPKDAALDAMAPSVARDYEEAMAAGSAAMQAADIERLNNDRRNLLRALNEARTRYAARLSEQQRTQGEEAATYSPDTPCAEPVRQTSGGAWPGFAEGNAAPDSFYPDSSRRAEYEGSVSVTASVSAAGCLQKASVYTSSGVPELDEAAIRWTRQARFLPAEHDHQAVDATLRFVVKFKMRN